MSVITAEQAERRWPVQVDAQNVYGYCQEHVKEHGWDDLMNFVCVRLPFPVLAVRFQSQLHSYEVRMFEKLPTDPLFPLTPAERDCRVLEAITRLGAEVGEVYRLFVSTTVDGQILPVVRVLYVDEAGHVLENGQREAFVDVYAGRVAIWSEADQLYLRDAVSSALVVALATVNFMNCRNVEVVDHLASRQQRRYAERHELPPPMTFKTLVIHPLRRRYGRTAGPTTGVESALHICRGHFKDFRVGPGLGRSHVRGIWWWHPQVRGTAHRGIVSKGYEVIVQDEKEEKVG